jgi:hypothetical protein
MFVENRFVLTAILRSVRAAATRGVRQLRAVLRAATRPAPMIVAMLRDLTRSREELVPEKTLLRQQLIVAARTTKRPKFAPQ